MKTVIGRIAKSVAVALMVALSPLVLAATEKKEALEAYGRLPLTFVPNQGQMDRRVRFGGEAGGATFWFTPGEAVFSFAQKEKGLTLRLRFIGANPMPEISGARRGTGTVNYLIGNDRTKWRTGIPTYGELIYRNLWPGIDLMFRGEEGRLKYEFHVGPGANVADIRLHYRGADSVAPGPAGELLLSTGLGTISDARPVSYQIVDGQRRLVDSRYVVHSRGGTHGFAVGSEYDRRHALVIDPEVNYSTYLGGSGSESGFGIAVDETGNAYVTGFTDSINFPTTAGAFDTTVSLGFFDAFVTKLDASGSALIFSTYLGGNGNDGGRGIALDAVGNVYVAGFTASNNFPTTAGAFDTGFNGSNDGFVTKLNPAGSAPLVYSTYVGGSGDDQANGVVLDAAGNAYIAGITASPNFPTTAGAFDTTFNGASDAFVTKLNATGSAPLLYSTFLGGSAFDESLGIAVGDGHAYVTGRTASTNFPTTAGAFDTSFNGVVDVFVTKMSATGSAPLGYSTFVGGSSNDLGLAIAFHVSGIYITGFTSSTDFPTTAGAFDTSFGGNDDAFVTKLNATGSAPLLYSTYLGDSGIDHGRGIAVDEAGSAHVTGNTTSANFPTTADAFDTSLNGSSDVFMTKLNAAGSAPLEYSTFLGGLRNEAGQAIAVDSRGNAYVTGVTPSEDFPTTPVAFDTTFNGAVDAFVTKLAVGKEDPVPATVTLDPASAVNPVDSTHTVRATVEDATGQPVGGITVRFTVSGSVSASGSCETEASGECIFTYTGPALPGIDAISAFADTDEDGGHDTGEPSGTATKSWVLPASTAGCKVNAGGWITAVNGDRANFGGNANAGVTIKGQAQYTDHGPAASMNLHSTSLDAVVCSSTTASIFGRARIDGAGTFAFRIDVQDLGEPGSSDMYRIRMSNGYDSGEQVVMGGNVQIHNR